MASSVSPDDLQAIGYTYDKSTDKWNIREAAADYIYTAGKMIDFALPGTLKVICDYAIWKQNIFDNKDNSDNHQKYYPLFKDKEFLLANERSGILNCLKSKVQKF